MSDGVNSDVFVIIALDRGLVIIGGTPCGEIKKAIFTIMTTPIEPYLSLLGNTDGEKSALFFGLSERNVWVKPSARWR